MGKRVSDTWRDEGFQAEYSSAALKDDAGVETGAWRLAASRDATDLISVGGLRHEAVKVDVVGASPVEQAGDHRVEVTPTADNAELNAPGDVVFINEFHYDNGGPGGTTDVGEFIEIAATAGTDLTGWSVVRYNGANGQVYTSPGAIGALSGTVTDQTGTGWGFVTLNYPTDGLQNGAPDGFALVDNLGNVIEFLSYEGTMTATSGPAAGLTSQDVGVFEPGNAAGTSIQRTGVFSTTSQPFTWAVVTGTTSGAANTGQTFEQVGPATPVVTVEATDAAGSEDGDAGPVFTFTRTGDLTDALEVTYTLDGSATDGADYTGATGTVTFAAGSATATVTLTVVDDAFVEGDETVTVTVVDGADYDVGAVSSADGTIIDNDAISVSIDDVTITEGDSGTSIATFTVTRTGSDAAFSVDYSTQDVTASAGSDYAAASGTLSFAAGEMSQTISVVINGDTTPEPNETFTVDLSNATNGALIADGSGQGTITNDDRTLISQIQGDSFYSPILAADGILAFNQASTTRVTVEAIVTSITSTGFYIMEEEADWDSDNHTSEGLFVAFANAATAGITVGERVELEGAVLEFQDFTNQPRTRLTDVTLLNQSNSVEDIPTWVLDGTAGRQIPNSILSDDNPDYFDSQDDIGDTFDPENDALDFFETLEGMHVTIPDMVVADGVIDGSNNTVRFDAYSTVHADADQINSRGGYTIAGEPGVDVTQGGRHIHDGDTNPDILELDFLTTAGGMGGTAGFHNLLSMGDQLGDISGIITFDFNALKLVVTDHQIDVGNLGGNPGQETTNLTHDDRSLRVATFNVENLTFGDPQSKFDGLAQAIAENLAAPDIICIEEVQDNNGTAGGTTDASQTWEKLVAALNAATGKNYQWVDQEPVNGAEGGAPGGNIRTGFLYDTARVSLGGLDADATLAERRQYTDRIGDGVRDVGDLIAFDDSMIASEINATDWLTTRKSLLGEFIFNGNTVYVSANHLPSKGGSGEFYQLDQNISTGAPENSDWDQRNEIGEDLWHMMNLIAQSDPDARQIAGGDFNDFQFYRPNETIAGYVDADGVARTDGARFMNLLIQELSIAERYTYVFGGRSQAIDHIFSDMELAALAELDVVHLNTGFNTRTGGDNPSLSDHDPLLSRFDFRSLGEILAGNASDNTIDGLGGNDTINGLDGHDTLNGDDGNDTLNGGLGDDILTGGAGSDTMTGGLGDDTYYVTDSTDVVVELAGEGIDTVNSSITYDLTGTEIENAALMWGLNRNLYGNAMDNVLTGNSGNNILIGGAGADTLIGGLGNDSYYVDSTLDTIVELAGEGIDTVRSIVTVKLEGTHIENAYLIGNLARNVLGNEVDNILKGNHANNIIAGKGGADELWGLRGVDTFDYNNVSESNSITMDVIMDLEAHDIIDLAGVDANATVGGNQAFELVGAFSNQAGQLRLEYVAGDNATYLLGDTDGDGTADLVVKLMGDHSGFTGIVL